MPRFEQKDPAFAEVKKHVDAGDLSILNLTGLELFERFPKLETDWALTDKERRKQFFKWWNSVRERNGGSCTGRKKKNNNNMDPNHVRSDDRPPRAPVRHGPSTPQSYHAPPHFHPSPYQPPSSYHPPPAQYSPHIQASLYQVPHYQAPPSPGYDQYALYGRDMRAVHAPPPPPEEEEEEEDGEPIPQTLVEFVRGFGQLEYTLKDAAQAEIELRRMIFGGSINKATNDLSSLEAEILQCIGRLGPMQTKNLAGKSKAEAKLTLARRKLEAKMEEEKKLASYKVEMEALLQMTQRLRTESAVGGHPQQIEANRPQQVVSESTPDSASHRNQQSTAKSVYPEEKIDSVPRSEETKANRQLFFEKAAPANIGLETIQEQKRAAVSSTSLWNGGSMGAPQAFGGGMAPTKLDNSYESKPPAAGGMFAGTPMPPIAENGQFFPIGGSVQATQPQQKYDFTSGFPSSTGPKKSSKKRRTAEETEPLTNSAPVFPTTGSAFGDGSSAQQNAFGSGGKRSNGPPMEESTQPVKRTKKN